MGLLISQFSGAQVFVSTEQHQHVIVIATQRFSKPLPGTGEVRFHNSISFVLLALLRDISPQLTRFSRVCLEIEARNYCLSGQERS